MKNDETKNKNKPGQTGAAPGEIEKMAHQLWVSHLWDRIDIDRAGQRVKARIAADKNRRRLVRNISISVPTAAAVLLAILTVLDKPGSDLPQFAERVLIQQTDHTGIVLQGDNGREYLLNDNNPEIAVSIQEKIIKDGGIIKIIPGEEKEEEPQTAASLRMKITIPRGREHQIVLADGTKVWLSAETSLTFPLCFTGETREVDMTGEAYFEVAHDLEKPFIVHSNEMSLKVLGTTFNIYAYPKDQAIITTLLEGAVMQSFDGRKGEIVLAPAEQTRYFKAENTLSVSKIHPEDFRAYREGKIVFRDISLEEILLSLSRTYDREIEIDKAWLKYDKYTLTVNKSDNITVALDKLKETGGFAYDEIEEMIRIY